MDAYVALRGSHNTTEFSDVAPDRMKLAMKLLQPVVERRVNKQNGSSCGGRPRPWRKWPG